MKKAIGIGVLSIAVLGCMLLSARIAVFIDLPTTIMIVVIGGLNWFLSPEKKGKAFVEAGWLTFSIGLVAGMYSCIDAESIGQFAGTLAVSSVALVYGYLIAIILDGVTSEKTLL